MHTIEQIFINGEFVTPHGTERFNLYNPATAQVMGQVRLADEVDAERAIAAAKAAFPAWSRTTKQERIVALKRMHAAVAARHDALLDAIVEEYGAPASRSAWMASYPAEVIAQAIEALEAFEFVTPAGAATVQMTPLGVAGLITPWNSDAGFICGKLAAALAAGCTAVIKPSEMSALQTQIVTEALRNAAESFKRVTLELGGKSPTILLDDVDLEQAIPLVIQAGFMNSGQACVAGTRILVPYSRKAEIETELAQAVAAVKSGDPRSSATDVGPMVSEKPVSYTHL
ncbi:aldehyde dehydrogenase [Enterobacter sp. KINAN-G]|nr:aldehyde dehydrogenase [Enterobacter sp. KINAN-G]